MLEISNVKVYDLRESIIASGNAMRIEPVPYSDEEFEKGLKRIKRLVHSSLSTDVHCHDNALTGIRVSFDIKYPQYWSFEFQRYHFAECSPVFLQAMVFALVIYRLKLFIVSRDAHKQF